MQNGEKTVMITSPPQVNVFRLEKLISWRSQKQPCVALSTTEAEYIPFAGTAQEAVWLRELCKNMNKKQTSPTLIYKDDQSAILCPKILSSMGKQNTLELNFILFENRSVVRKLN